jgi:cytochrome c biogenesis protein CcdA/thiol-disulfide isomerase/thioredoxin
MLLLIISFLAGCLTVFAPCVLPLLPVIVGGSISSKIKDRLRPYIITISLAVSIIVFTLLLKVSTLLINLSPNALNYFSGGIIVILGLVTLFPGAWEQLVIKLNWQAGSQRLLGKSENASGRYLGPILIGVSLGPVFSSCSPTYAFILASVLPHSFVSGLIYLIVYAIGVVLTLLAVALGGKKIISRYTWAIDTHSTFRRALGVLFIVIGFVIFTGKITSVETYVANHTPFDETRIERLLLSKQGTPTLVHSIKTHLDSRNVLNVQPTTAPQFAGLTNWINSKPLTLSQLKGKVVLVDFWTFSCINCIRSIPYIESYYQTYHKDGFEVVGINTPEFAFEHNPANVAAAVIKDKITYPVALDNNYDTWNAYDNDSWPADYLIDKSGNIRYVSLGEGNYNVTEEAIQQLLGIDKPLTAPKSVVPVSQNQTDETYFGTEREASYVGQPTYKQGTSSFTPQLSLGAGQWTLGGQWQVSNQYITSESSSSTLTINLSAKDVYLVAGSTQPLNVQVTLPDADEGQYGVDAPAGTATINGSRLYHIASFNKFTTGNITLTVPAGVSLYTFTFGS